MSVQPEPAGPTPAAPDLVGRIRVTGRCELLLQLLEVASFTAKLTRPGPFTLLAPPDAAFIELPCDAVNALLEDPAQARSFIRRHLASGRFPLHDLRAMRRLTTLSGQDIPVNHADGTKLGDAAVTHPDLLATNGVAHLIDRLLTPQG